jgi:hypothetical protein
MSDLSPTEKLLCQELAAIKEQLAALVAANEKEAKPRMLPLGTYFHHSSPKADVKPPKAEADSKLASMASIYGKEQKK